MTTDFSHPLGRACLAVAREVLSQNGTTSSDLVETLAARFLSIAEGHQDFVRHQRETDDVIAHAVGYIAHVHANPSRGTDTGWFRDTLATLIELAVPNAGLDEEASRLLPDLQFGLRQSLADVPVSRASFRVNDEEAGELERLKEAGSEHGVVSLLLDVLEKHYYGDPLSHEEQRYFALAALAAPITRRAREDATHDDYPMSGSSQAHRQTHP